MLCSECMGELIFIIVYHTLCLATGPYSLWRGSNSSVSVEITVNGVVYEGILKATGTVRTSQTSGKRVA